MSYSDIALDHVFQCDNHVHTYLCGHAVGTMEEYVVAAIKNGLRSITFLEHMEAGIIAARSSWLTDEDFDFYFTEGERLREKYGDRLSIRLGVECGYNPECRQELQEKLSQRKWDEIGISCHFLKIDGHAEHFNLLSKRPENVRRFENLDCERLFTRYLETLTEAVNSLDGTVLCHLDAALRWVPAHRITSNQYQLIDILLAAVAARGMALEINTSGFAIRGEPFPNSRIIELAENRKLKFVLGSDAHKPEDVGNFFDRLSSTPSSTPSR